MLLARARCVVVTDTAWSFQVLVAIVTCFNNTWMVSIRAMISGESLPAASDKRCADLTDGAEKETPRLGRHADDDYRSLWRWLMIAERTVASASPA